MENRRMHPPRISAARAALLLPLCALAALWISTPTGCFLYKDDPLYCPGMPNNTCVDGAMPCTSSDQCSAPLAVCDLGATNVCVECTPSSAAACLGTKPVCGTDNACRACSKHAECASAACLPDGACGDDSNVAYVAPTGMGTACTKINPCKKVDDALKTGRPYVKFSGVTDEAVTVDKARQVTFLADTGAKLTRGTGGAILTVKDDGTTLTVYDLTIIDAPNNASGFGVLVPAGSGAPTVRLTRVTLQNNPAGGISASGGSLSVSQSTISANQGGGISASGGSLSVSQSTISANQGGGISISNAAFEVVNTFFFGNGGLGSTVGGIAITTTQNAANRLEFNSFNKNQTQDGIAPAIQCIAGVFTARNNIMSGNGTLTQMTQYGGTCQHAYSIATPGPLPAGTGNLASDPMFVNTTTGDLHISGTSPARAAADPTSALTGLSAIDVDGQPRTSPADIGADEVP
jgi:hypothetical protein